MLQSKTIRHDRTDQKKKKLNVFVPLYPRCNGVRSLCSDSSPHQLKAIKHVNRSVFGRPQLNLSERLCLERARGKLHGEQEASGSGQLSSRPVWAWFYKDCGHLWVTHARPHCFFWWSDNNNNKKKKLVEAETRSTFIYTDKYTHRAFFAQG